MGMFITGSDQNKIHEDLMTVLIPNWIWDQQQWPNLVPDIPQLPPIQRTNAIEMKTFCIPSHVRLPCRTPVR